MHTWGGQIPWSFTHWSSSSFLLSQCCLVLILHLLAVFLSAAAPARFRFSSSRELLLAMAFRPDERALLEPLLAFLCLFAACIEICDAAAVVDAYRMIQYDLKGIPFGSRRAGLNHHAGSMLFTHQATDLSRTVIIVPIVTVNISALNEYLQSKRLLGGLLLLLPRKFGNQETLEGKGDSEDADADSISKIADLEQWLIHNTLPYPVYFTLEDEILQSVLREVEENDAAGRHATAITGGYKLVVPVREPKKLATTTLTNIQGWLPGLRADGESAQLPTIAIVASYDTFGAAPALSYGSDSNGSGVVALLELARLFSRLFANAKTRGKFNILFGLTAGGPYNYDGTAKWLKSFDQRLRESIDYAICLNSIGSRSNDLWLHVSKPPDSAYIKQIHDGMQDVAGGLGIEVKIRHKKINISNPRVAWEHEQFSRQRVTAATLSKLDKAPELLEHAGGLSDRREYVDAEAIAQSVKLVAESIAKHIYGYQGRQIEVFANNSSLAVSPSYIGLWLDLLSRTPRVAPFLSKTDPIITALKKELGDHTTDVSIQHDVLDNSFTFYDLPKTELNIYQVASITFDLVITVAVLLYLSVLYILLVITTKSFDDLFAVFRRPPSKKAKAA